MPIDGQEYFTTEQPGFIWIGKIKSIPLVWITGLDEYVKGKGKFQIKLMSIFTVADTRGPGLSSFDGGFSEYILVLSYRFVVRVDKRNNSNANPESLAPLTDAGLTSYHLKSV